MSWLSRLIHPKAHEAAERQAVIKQASWDLRWAVLLDSRADEIPGLLAAGADPNACDIEGESVLSTAVAMGKGEIVRKLAGHGANLEARSERHGTPLHAAVSNGNKAMAELLIELGADVNGHAAGLWAPLMVAVRNGDREMVDLLIEFGADMNIASRGETALDFAISEGHFGIAQRLQQAGGIAGMPLVRHLENAVSRAGWADVDRIDQLIAFAGGFTADDLGIALIEAARRRRKDMAEFLIRAGADANMRDPQGKTAFEIAERNGPPEMIQLLAEAGGRRAPVALTDVIMKSAQELLDLPVRPDLACQARGGPEPGDWTQVRCFTIVYEAAAAVTAKEWDTLQQEGDGLKAHYVNGRRSEVASYYRVGEQRWQEHYTYWSD